MSDYDKHEWQAEQAQRDAALDKQREKERKARERSARNARRKLERLHKTLSETGEITDFEDEFGESVVERLGKYGSAFQDREKGRPGDALSFAQKRVMAAMNKKVKDLKKPAGAKSDGYTPRSSFKSKGKPKFTPRVRDLEDDMPDEAEEAFIPKYEPSPAPVVKKPFLRLVNTDRPDD